MSEYLVFSGRNCSACDQLKLWLNSQDIKFTQVNVETEPVKAHNHMVRGVPTSIKLTGDLEAGRIVGFQLAEAKQFFKG